MSPANRSRQQGWLWGEPAPLLQAAEPAAGKGQPGHAPGAPGWTCGSICPWQAYPLGLAVSWGISGWFLQGLQSQKQQTVGMCVAWPSTSRQEKRESQPCSSCCRTVHLAPEHTALLVLINLSSLSRLRVIDGRAELYLTKAFSIWQYASATQLQTHEIWKREVSPAQHSSLGTEALQGALLHTALPDPACKLLMDWVPSIIQGIVPHEQRVQGRGILNCACQPQLAVKGPSSSHCPQLGAPSEMQRHVSAKGAGHLLPEGSAHMCPVGDRAQVSHVGVAGAQLVPPQLCNWMQGCVVQHPHGTLRKRAQCEHRVPAPCFLSFSQGVHYRVTAKGVAASSWSQP